MHIRRINSLDDLKKFAHDLRADLRAGDVVGLSGELGAGKTTLVQMAAKELGVRDRVVSPSFNLVKIYDLPKPVKKIDRICHIDLYRIDKIGSDLGFEEYFSDVNSVCFVEWAEKIKHLLPASAKWISIDIQKDNSRIIKKQ